MKKRFFVLILLFMLIAIVLGAIYIRSNKIRMDFATEGTVYFIHDDVNVASPLSDEDLNSIKGILDGKRMYKDNLSCGFSEDVSIKFNQSQTFCIARDTCPIVYWKEENCFIKLTEEEQSRLYELLEKYGFFFPCV